MNTTIEETLAKLQADHEAQATLLAEASAKIAGLEQQVTNLTARNESLLATADSANAQVTALQTQVADLTAQNTELTASQADFTTKVALEAARIAAYCGTSVPVRVSARPDAQTITRAELHAMTPDQRMDHFRRGGKLID